MLTVLNESYSMVRRIAHAPLKPSTWFPITHASLRRRHDFTQWHAPQWQRSLFARLRRELAPHQRYSIEPDKGFTVVDPSNEPTVQAAIECARLQFPGEWIRDNFSNPSKQDRLLSVDVDIRKSEHRPITDLAMSPSILSAVADYLTEPAVLFGAAVWFCPNTTTPDLIGSQLFHCDRQDWRQAKFFIPIDPIDETCGPTSVVSATATRKFFGALKALGRPIHLKQRFSDEDVHRLSGEREKALVGRPGTLLICDTNSCLHYGSRPAQKPKYHLVLQYASPYNPAIANLLRKLLVSAKASAAEFAACYLNNVDKPKTL
jgi:hypothetical protein